ncbi:hypothetical protein [Streptomyces sp. NPDC026589]|uniref:hypothetical protein n=1 Tax=Streptomyces sp. NPDC026589 TaxID=3155609 RepID=UPI0033DFE201
METDGTVMRARTSAVCYHATPSSSWSKTDVCEAFDSITAKKGGTSVGGWNSNFGYAGPGAYTFAVKATVFGGNTNGGSEISIEGGSTYNLDFTVQKVDSAVIEGKFMREPSDDEDDPADVMVANIGNVPARGTALILRPMAEPGLSEPLGRCATELIKSPRDEAKVRKAREALGENERETTLSTDAHCVGDATVAV